MKNLTIQQLGEAPAIVQTVYTGWMCNRDISNSTMDLAIQNYPDYFQDEIELREKAKKLPPKQACLFFMEMHRTKGTILRTFGTGVKGQTYVTNVQKSLIEKYYLKSGIKA